MCPASSRADIIDDDALEPFDGDGDGDGDARAASVVRSLIARGRVTSSGGARRTPQSHARAPDDDDARARAEAMTSSSPSPLSPTPRECVDDTSPEATTTTTAEEETTRSKVVILLAGALGDATPLCDHGAKLERALYIAHGGVGRAYRTRARELVANFKRNVKLAASVVRGDTSAEDVVTMPVTDLATEEAQIERDRMEERAVRKRTRTHFDDGVNSEAYVCPECGSNQCKYVMLSDSRDVRKAEIWGGSSNDECLALIQCQNCQHEWKTSK